MAEYLKMSVYFGMILSIASYVAGMKLQKKYKSALFNPLLIAIVVSIVVIKALHVDYDTYNASAKYLSYLLTPATVALAVPLYRQVALLKEHFAAVMLGILSGVLASLGSILVMAYLFGLGHREYVTLLPKSITTAIGMGVSEELGGIATITVAVIVVTGVLGNVIAEQVCKVFRITHPISVGLAIGTSSHGAGTAKAMELGEIQGAMSSLSIVVAGIMTVVGASVFANFL